MFCAYYNDSVHILLYLEYIYIVAVALIMNYFEIKLILLNLILMHILTLFKNITVMGHYFIL